MGRFVAFIAGTIVAIGFGFLLGRWTGPVDKGPEQAGKKGNSVEQPQAEDFFEKGKKEDRGNQKADLLPHPDLEKADTVGTWGTILNVAVAENEIRNGCSGSIEVKRDRGTIIFFVSGKTKIEKMVGSKAMPCDFGFVKKGDKVEIKYNPIVAPTDPPQAVAYRIIVLSQPK